MIGPAALKMVTCRRVVLVIGVIVAVLGILSGGRYLIRKRAPQQRAIKVPQLSPEATVGQVAFATNCLGCHGQNAAGADKGPSLLDPIYSPSHHSDFSFVRAVVVGVPQHHWLFGAMPAQPQVERKQIDQLIIYIRELQRANGIT